MNTIRPAPLRWLAAIPVTILALFGSAAHLRADDAGLELLSSGAEKRLQQGGNVTPNPNASPDSNAEPDSGAGGIVGVNYPSPDFAEALPPSPTGDNLVSDLSKRLADVEKQLKKRDDADKKSTDAAAKKFTVRPFGRVHADAASFLQDADNKATVGDARSGVDLRRARFGFEGEGFETFFYRFDVDFASFDSNSNNTQSSNQRPVVQDAYLDTMNLPLIGNLRVGRFREPFGLERLDSTNDLPFLERSLPTNALAPFRNMGIMGFDCNEAQTRTWSYGVFTENSNAYGEALPSRGGIAFTGRTTWLPWYDELAEGRYLLHLGASYSYRLVGNQQTRFGTPPEMSLKQNTAAALFQTPRFVNTPVINMLDYHVAGVEATTMLGSLAIEAEYMFVSGNQVNNPNLFFHGGYIEAMYFLTGEHRNYNRKQGIHGPLQLHNNFFRVNTDEGIQTGWGAWEATARVSTLDLNSQNIRGGQLTDLTVGLNWYYTTRSRVMFNYIHAFLDAKGLNSTTTASNADILAVRYQWAF
jgi:phosphate-selective porin OprO/OprP